jgi:hypothetical protein
MRKSIWKFRIPWVLLLGLCLTGSVWAEGEREVKIRWSEVEGSNGYIVRIRNYQGRIQENQVKNNEFQTELSPGVYYLQVAGKNRFGKPGLFSEWKALEVRPGEKIQSYDLSEPSSGSNPESPEINPWMRWIPGYPQYQRNDWDQSLGYFLGISLLTYSFQSEKIRGTAIARNPWNDPSILYFSLLTSPLETRFLAENLRDGEKKRYNQAQQNQRYAVAGLGILFAIHLVDEYFFSGSGTMTSFQLSPMPPGISVGDRAFPGLGFGNTEFFQGISFQLNLDLGGNYE